MSAELRVVDPTRAPGRARRAYAAFGASRVARFISRHINWKLDPVLLRISRGRLSTTLMIRSAVLETRGAKTGKPRRNAVIYFHDDDRVVIVASNAGASTHPSWFHNLRAHPDVTFGATPMRAAVVEDEQEQERLSALGDRVFPAFETFRGDAAKVGRRIPIVQLSPLE